LSKLNDDDDDASTVHDDDWGMQDDPFGADGSR